MMIMYKKLFLLLVLLLLLLPVGFSVSEKIFFKPDPCAGTPRPTCSGCNAGDASITVEWKEDLWAVEVSVTGGLANLELGDLYKVERRMKDTVDWSLLGYDSNPYFDYVSGLDPGIYEYRARVKGVEGSIYCNGLRYSCKPADCFGAWSETVEVEIPVASDPSRDLRGFKLDSYTKTFPETGVILFTLNQNTNVYFYAEDIEVISPDSDKKYFIEIPSTTTLKPCFGSNCIFSQGAEDVTFNSNIDVIILDGTIDLRTQEDSVNLIIRGDLNVNGLGKIISAGKDGEDGIQNITECILTGGKKAGKTAKISISGKTFVSENSSLEIDASGGNGGNGADGIYVAGSCTNNLNGTNAGNAGNGNEIILKWLVLADSAEILLDVNGGNGGIGGIGIQGGSNGSDGLGGNAGKISIKRFFAGDSKMNFTALKGTGRELVSLTDGNVSIKGCDLKDLTFEKCDSGVFELRSNDIFDLTETLQEICVVPEIDFLFNCDCFQEDLTSTNVIFSLTGSIKDFAGENLSGSLSNFNLTKESGEAIVSDSFPKDFFNGFFNFSFGKGQPIFSDPEMKLDFSPLHYLLKFTASSSGLSDLLAGSFSLIDYWDEFCGKYQMKIPFNGRIRKANGSIVQEGTIKNIKITAKDSGETTLIAEEISFSGGVLSAELNAELYPDTFYLIEFDVCENVVCESFEFDFFTWKKLWLDG